MMSTIFSADNQQIDAWKKRPGIGELSEINRRLREEARLNLLRLKAELRASGSVFHQSLALVRQTRLFRQQIDPPISQQIPSPETEEAESP